MLNNYMKDKDVGFWFSASLVVFSLITAVPARIITVNKKRFKEVSV